MERPDVGHWSAREVARLLALLEAQLAYFREIAAALPIPLAILNRDRTVIWTNRAFRSRYKALPAKGFTEIPLRAWHDEDEVETLLVLEPPPQVASAAAATLSEDVPAIFWQADAATFRFLSVDGGPERMFGRPASYWLGNSQFFEERIHPDDRASTLALYRNAIASGGEASAEYRSSESTAGQIVWCRETLRVSGDTIRGVITDITARKQMERQLLTAGRFEALYAFAGRLAHDLNNPLMIVTGYAEELMQALKPTDPLRQEAGEILGAARRIGGIAAQLTDFARRQGRPASVVNLGDTILNARAKLSAAAGEGVALELNANSAAILASADAVQLAEVLSAVVAGVQRSTPRERTRVAVAWGVTAIEERLSPTALAAGKYASITVRDDGHGLDAEQAVSVFDPALSKNPAAGTPGLALARAYSIVHEWGGDIAFASQPGQGSTFTIYLPYVEPETGPATAHPPAPKAAAKREGSPTILVVEDEAGIRELIRKILQRERFQVLEAASAEEALTLAQSQAIDLVITDVMLPGIHGPELAARMQKAAPRLKILFISGFTGEEKVPAGARFLAKPFTLVSLISKVREALAE